VFKWGIFGVVVASWGIAFFEYMFQVPANRLGYRETGGSFNLVELCTTLLIATTLSN
jgi:uncharacterized protein (DUF486 family)